MTLVRASVEVLASPEEVWRVVADPNNLAYWDRHIAAIQDVGDLREGLAYATEIRFMGVAGRVEVEVLEIDAPHLARLRLQGLINAAVTTTVTELAEGESLLEHEIDYRFRGGALGSFAAEGLRFLGGARYVLQRGTLAQKRQIESGAR